MLYLNIFMAFLRSGLLCWGGGPVSLPFIRREAVERYAWLTDAQFAEVVAAANALPGPINTKMAGYIGYKTGGIPGLILGLIAMIAPTSIVMVILMATLTQFADQPWAQGMSRAMVPVVGAMLAILAWQFFAIAAKGLGWAVSIPLAVVAFALFWFLRLHPAWVLGALLIWAFLPVDRLADRFKDFRRKRSRKNEDDAP